jgi:hypothetical protein
MIALRCRTLDEAQNEKQDDCPDGRDNQAPDQTAIGPNAQRAKNDTSQQRPNDANHNVAQDAKPATFHHLSCQPTRSR